MRQPPDASTARCTWCDASRSAPRSSTRARGSAATATSAIGEEAATVGAIDRARRGRLPVRRATATTASRSRAASDPTAVMAELFGKATGVRAAATAARCTCSTSSAASTAAGASSAGSCRSRSARRSRSITTGHARRRPLRARRRRDQHRRLARGAEPRRASGTCRSSSWSSTTCTAWARRSARPRPSPSSTSAPPPTGCTASGSTATTSRPCARRPAGCCARPARSAGPPCSRRMTYRYPRPLGRRRRQGLPHQGRDRRVAQGRDPIERFGRARDRARACSTERRDRRSCARRSPSEVAEPPIREAAAAAGDARSRRDRRQRLRRPGHRREQFARMRRRRPVRRAARGRARGRDVTYREALRRALARSWSATSASS